MILSIEKCGETCEFRKIQRRDTFSRLPANRLTTKRKSRERLVACLGAMPKKRRRRELPPTAFQSNVSAARGASTSQTRPEAGTLVTPAVARAASQPRVRPQAAAAPPPVPSTPFSPDFDPESERRSSQRAWWAQHSSSAPSASLSKGHTPSSSSLATAQLSPIRAPIFCDSDDDVDDVPGPLKRSKSPEATMHARPSPTSSPAALNGTCLTRGCTSYKLAVVAVSRRFYVCMMYVKGATDGNAGVIAARVALRLRFEQFRRARPHKPEPTMLHKLTFLLGLLVISKLSDSLPLECAASGT